MRRVGRIRFQDDGRTDKLKDRQARRQARECTITPEGFGVIFCAGFTYLAFSVTRWLVPYPNSRTPLSAARLSQSLLFSEFRKSLVAECIYLLASRPRSKSQERCVVLVSSICQLLPDREISLTCHADRLKFSTVLLFLNPCYHYQSLE